MKYTVSLLLFIFLGINCSAAIEVKPGNQKIEKFINEQGFYQNTVKAITSDDNGYLWISTPNGLVRYDGYSFDYFYHNPDNPESIPNNNIGNLLKDFEGKLWIGSLDGLCLYSADKEQFLPLKYKIKNETFIKEGPQKRVWVGKGSQLHIFESTGGQDNPANKVGVVNLEENLEQAIISDIDFLSATQILVATENKMYIVTLLNPNDYSFEISLLQSENKYYGIKKIIKSENSLWIGTSNGIFQTFLENNSLTVIRSFFSSNGDNSNQQIGVLSMFLDQKKDLWIGTKENGVLKYNSLTNNFISFKYDAKNDLGLTSNRINCFYEDDFGVMWIGTAQGGLNKLNKNQKPFHNYSHNPYDLKSLSGNLITNIAEDKHGKIWLSFYNNTICRTTKKADISEGNQMNFERLEKQLGKLSNESVLSIFQDSRGFWWFGTEQSIYLYDEIREMLIELAILCRGKKVETGRYRVITQPDENHILIGGLEVLLLENPWATILKDKPVLVENKLFELGNDNSATAFVQDSFGNYWIATRNGVYRLVNVQGEWIVKDHLTADSNTKNLQLSNNFIFSIYKNLNKDIWLGSFGGGLMKIQLNPAGEPEKIKTYHKKDGLPDEAVYGILEDENGNFWISTDMGICRFDPISEEFDVYDLNDGILNNNFRQSAFLKTEAGILLMGGLNGLTVFNPLEITKNKILPKVLISQLKINNQAIVTGEKLLNKVILENSISDTKKLVLGHQNRNISLDIIVRHSAAPKKNRLSYMLEGVNKDWVDVNEGKTTATYTNLNAGTYRFLYKGANGDGIWTEKTSKLTIQVLAPWYLRWYSLTIWAIIAVLFVYGIFRYLVRLEKLKQRLKFEQLDKERVHEMDQAKLRFFTNISHEFKTPLSLIIGPLEKIAERNKNKEDQKYFSIIQNNISRLQRLIEQLISYRKAETGHLELKYSKTSLGNFIYPVLEAFEEKAKNTNINFYYKVSAPNRQVIIDIDKTERILLNLISNAIKFTELNGDVSIDAGFKDTPDGEKLYIDVMDTGIGIAAEKIDKIFDRFYRAVEDRGSWSGTGIGLALCKSLIDLMKGTIAVESVQGKKTTFGITLPFDSSVDIEAKEEHTGKRKFVTDWMPSEFHELKEESTDATLPSLLIVDDEYDVRSFLQEAFHHQFKVTLAVDGEDGLEKMKEKNPSLVISDVMMPKLDGYQLCEKIKSNPKTCHIPVILLTALNESSKKIEGLEQGADDYITKPFSIKHLEARVKQLIENKQRIVNYFSKSSVIPEKEIKMPEKERIFLEKIVASIEKNISDSGFGVEELAKDAGLSTSHLYRRLKQLTGQVPNVYIRNFRLQKAAELLKSNEDLNATEVMYEIGIESPSYFSTSFKKLHGVSPSEYMKNQE